MEIESKPLPTPTSDQAVSSIMGTGFQSIAIQGTVGLVVGGMAGLVLARGGASGARKAFAGLGAGIGAGSAWTRCSMELEDLLK
jgi:hypothetical protein